MQPIIKVQGLAKRYYLGGPSAAYATLRETIIGRNVIEGRWTFQLVEEFDDGYWQDLRSFERGARNALVQGRRHLYEAEMKEDRRTPGDPDHTAVPPSLVEDARQRRHETR